MHVSTGAHGGPRCWIPAVAGVISDYKYCWVLWTEWTLVLGEHDEILSAKPSL